MPGSDHPWASKVTPICSPILNSLMPWELPPALPAHGPRSNLGSQEMLAGAKRIEKLQAAG